MTKPRFDYVELPASALDDSVRFYEAAFGWTLQRFGPAYAATTTGDTDVGLQADSNEAPGSPLPVVQVDDIEATASAVEAAGGDIIKPIFDFPAGRRFHFRDPNGNELAAWSKS
jgi:predicted enzyme related to lactoylglutathione lyase